MTVSNEYLIFFTNETLLTPDQAKTYSQKVRTEWNAPSLIIWDIEKAKSQYYSALRIIDASFTALENQNFNVARQGFKRAGEILEWLSSINISFIEVNYLKILSGACYQLADLPAIASGVLNRTNNNSASESISKYFIKADYNKALKAIIHYFATSSRNNDLDPINSYIQLECLRVFGLISSIFRTGNDSRINDAKNKLSHLLNFTKNNFSSDDYLFLKLSNAVFVNNYKASIWEYIKPFSETLSPIGQLALKKYLRISFYNNKPIYWKSQLQAIDKLISFESFTLCTPTGSGKTLIAELAIIQALFKRESPNQLDEDGSLSIDDYFNLANTMKPLIIYIVPSRALASEVENKLHNSFKDIGSNVLVTGLYGGTEWNLSQAWLTADRPTVIISTIEKSDAILRNLGPVFLSRLSCIILDEAHQVLFNKTESNIKNLINANDRAYKLEVFISRVTSSKPSIRIVALSAVAGGSENFIAKWIARNDTESALTFKERSTRQLIGSLECKINGTSTIMLDILNGHQLNLASNDDEAAYVPSPFGTMPTLSSTLKDPSSFSSCNALWGAIKLSNANKKTLISISQKIYTYLKRYKKLFEDERAWINNCPAFFSVPTDESKLMIYNRCLTAIGDYCGSDSYEYYFLLKGIAVHHGQLPVRVRRLMTEVIKEGITPITIATSTLTEGVNLPFDIIFIPSLLRYNGAQSSEQVPISELKNLAGRAGRPGSSGEGIILIPLTSDPHSRAGTQANRNQLRAISNMKRSYNIFKRQILQSDVQTSLPNNSPLNSLLETLYSKWSLISLDRSIASFENWLENSVDSTFEDINEALDTFDLFIISSIEEIQNYDSSLSSSETELRLRLIWNTTYAHFSSSQNFQNSIVSRGRIILSGIHGDHNQRRLFYRIGMPPRRTNRILMAIGPINLYLQMFINYYSLNSEQKYEMIHGLIDRILQITDFRLTSSPDLLLITKWWLHVEDAQIPESNDVSEWLKFANNFFDIQINNALNLIISHIWNTANNGEFVIPNLDTWKETTNLPWSVFWLKETLSWGTTEPLVALLLANNLVETREEANLKISEYQEWLENDIEQIIGDEIYNPKHMNRWIRETFRTQSSSPDSNLIIPISSPPIPNINTQYRLNVYPFRETTSLKWFDPAGYVLAVTEIPTNWNESNFEKYDFHINLEEGNVVGELII